ncbi:MAG: PQQ-dependent sugar dehydrogenase [Gemmataceae bacterium]
MRALLLVILPLFPAAAHAQLPEPIAKGIKNPESVVVGGDKRIYITSIGERGKDGDGAVLVLNKGKLEPFVTGLDDPRGIAAFQKWLFVADNKRVWRIDLAGKKTEIPAKAFPSEPVMLNDVVVDPETGLVYVSDSGDKDNAGGAVFRIPFKGKITTVTDQKRWPELKRPNGLAMDGQSFFLLVDSATGELHRVHIATGKHEKVADGFGHADGIVWDHFGRLFISDNKGGKVYAIPRPGEKPILIGKGFESAADIALGVDGKTLLIPDMKAGTVTALKIEIPGWEVDETPLKIKAAPAFPELKWTGWSAETPAGVPIPLRPILLTHAGDGSNRVFVPTQHGVIHVFPNDQKATKTKVFLDIQKQVQYQDKENEEGFLGLAFHPKYKENGEFFVFYTTRKAKHPHTNILSRFRVSKDDPDRADPASEEELLRLERPFWNHDGGTITFGPDGFLYIALGDGGAANDPLNNGQNLKQLLGHILRIDVERKEDLRNYAIPKDNPFAGKKDVRPEIWAYGLRNVWRMAFDKKTGKLWAADVGQNLFEEINIVTKGGNYGWKIREGLHPFTAEGSSPRKDLIEPIWEYHHDIGKSITGGMVYRGKMFPELDGMYLYADYISNAIWALRYDEKKGRVTENRPFPFAGNAIMSWGEDEGGEAYFMTLSASGRGISRLVRGK